MSNEGPMINMGLRAVEKDTHKYETGKSKPPSLEQGGFYLLFKFAG